jgi:phage-related protein
MEKRHDPKPVVWIGSSHADLIELSDAVRYDFGYALYQVQLGEIPPHARSMHGPLREVTEIDTDDSGGTYRFVYTVKLGNVVYILHVFQKKSKRGIATPQKVLDLIEQRLRIAKVEHEKRNH